MYSCWLHDHITGASHIATVHSYTTVEGSPFASACTSRALYIHPSRKAIPSQFHAWHLVPWQIKLLGWRIDICWLFWPTTILIMRGCWHMFITLLSRIWCVILLSQRLWCPGLIKLQYDFTGTSKNLKPFTRAHFCVFWGLSGCPSRSF